MSEAPQTRTGRDRLGAITAPRESAFPAAMRHTARVNWMRRLILWAVGTIVVLVGVGLAVSSLTLLPVELSLKRVALKGSRIVIDSPKLVGYQKDGRPYEVRAKTGVQEISAPDVFDLDGLEVRVESSRDSAVQLSAKKGVYSAKTDRADMSGGVKIRDVKSFDMQLQSAVMDFKSSVMTSNKPVNLKIDGGEVQAKAVEFSEKERRATFSGGVHSQLYGEGSAPANAFHPAQPTQGQ